mgnify:CR=1 FL=1
MTPSERRKAFNAELRAQLKRRQQLQVHLYDDIITLLEKALMALDTQLAQLPTSLGDFLAQVRVAKKFQ